MTRRTIACRVSVAALTMLLPITARSQTPAPAPAPAPAPTPWYEKLRLRGYGQVRYNRLFETNDQLQCEQCDRSWGENGGVFIRRLRLVVQGQVHPRVFVYLQPDFAGDIRNDGKRRAVA
jgi:hypothetical protein